MAVITKKMNYMINVLIIKGNDETIISVQIKGFLIEHDAKKFIENAIVNGTKWVYAKIINYETEYHVGREFINERGYDY